MTYAEFCKEYHITSLNPQQEMAVKRTTGATLLLAVPGSGKTTVIVARTGYLLYVEQIAPENILTLTFTKAAAVEMKERFIKKFRIESEEQAPLFATINSFCLSVIRTCAREKGDHVPRLVPDNERVIREIASRMMRDFPSDVCVRNLAQQIGRVKNEMMTADQIKGIENLDVDFYEFFLNYRRYMAESGLMDFDDQLLMANRFLDQYPDILARAQKKYRYISLDEAQDTSRVQHCIVQKLVGRNGNIFMVGDEDQSIYGFRGAYPDALLSFTRDYDNAQILYLTTNYRSDKRIISASSEFIRQNTNRHDKQMAAKSRQEGSIRIYSIPDMKDQPREIMRAIQQHLSPGRGSLAILYRNNDSAIPILHLLCKNNITVRVREAAGIFFSHFAVNDILDLFRLAKTPDSADIFKRVYYKMGFYLPKAILPLLSEEMALGRYSTVFDALMVMPDVSSRWIRHRLQAVRDSLLQVQYLPPSKAILCILHSVGYWEYWIERKLEEGYNQMTIDMKIGALKMVAQECSSADEFLAALDDIRTYKGDGESNVTLSTIHSSKGLEFDKVILIDVLEGIFPSDSINKTLDEEEEEVRLFYVGITRARHSIQIIFPRAIYGDSVRPSRFVTALAESIQKEVEQL